MRPAALPPEVTPKEQGFRALAQPRWVTSEESEFPQRLREIPRIPTGLWMRTALPRALCAGLWECPAVAIVGSRSASAAGIEIARTLAWGVARAGVLVVSGLARGVDAAGHEGALLAGGQTVAVLASGLDRCYPPEHEEMAAAIAHNGALLSEWRSGTEPLPWRFPRRNRLISGLCDILVLVEGEARSGALHTVRFALEQGREVMAVPRDPILPGSQAPNRLIRDGAVPVLGAEDLLQQLRALRQPGRRARATAQRELLDRERGAGPVRMATRDTGEPGNLSARVLAELGRCGALPFNNIAGRLPEVDTPQLMAQLVQLEVEGRVHRDRSGRFHLCSCG